MCMCAAAELQLAAGHLLPGCRHVAGLLHHRHRWPCSHLMMEFCGWYTHLTHVILPQSQGCLLPYVSLPVLECAGLTIHNGRQPGISYNTNSFSTADAVLSGFNSLGIIVSGRPLWGYRLASDGMQQSVYARDACGSFRLLSQCPAANWLCANSTGIRVRWTQCHFGDPVDAAEPAADAAALHAGCGCLLAPLDTANCKRTPHVAQPYAAPADSADASLRAAPHASAGVYIAYAIVSWCYFSVAFSG